MTAELRPVITGRIFQTWTTIENGLAPGEKLVTEGQLRLTPGAKVEIKNAHAAEGASIEGVSTKSQAPNPK
jgi:multidrug efflux system membrane fusion protein